MLPSKSSVDLTLNWFPFEFELIKNCDPKLSPLVEINCPSIVESVPVHVIKALSSEILSIWGLVIARSIIFPAGVLSETDYFIRFIVIASSVSIFYFTKRNLVYPTVFSAIILYFLSILL